MHRAIGWLGWAAVSLWAAPLRADEAHRLDVAVLPGASFASDTGFGLGASGSFYRRSPARRPYAWALRLSVFATTGGVQDHAAALDIIGEAWRSMINLGYFRDRRRPYFGIGNTTSDAAPPGVSASDNRAYDLQAPFVQGSLERRFAGPWRLAVAIDLRWMTVGAEPLSRMAREAPTGSEGGFAHRVELELARDTRDAEASATAGTWSSVSVHGAVGRYASLGLAGELRWFAALLPRPTALVLATRGLADVTWGDVPVAQLSWFGGRSRVEGLGGSDSVRGLPRLRYIGQAKVLANVELRSRLGRRSLRGRPLDLWAVAFGDVGRVWAQVADDGPAWRFHGAAGAGVRVGWADDFVARLDIGRSADQWGFYATLDQLF